MAESIEEKMNPNFHDMKVQSTFIIDEMIDCKKDSIDIQISKEMSFKNINFVLDELTDIPEEQKWEPRSQFERKPIFKIPRSNNGSNANSRNSSFLNGSVNASFINTLTELKDRMIRRESVQTGNRKESFQIISSESTKTLQKNRESSFNDISICKSDLSNSISGKRPFMDVKRNKSIFAGSRFRLNSMRPSNNDTPVFEASENTREIVWTGLVPKWKEKKSIGSETEILLLKVIDSPISLGFFMAFCESEHNEEYVAFYVAVADLKTTSPFDQKAVVNKLKIHSSFDPFLDTSNLKTESRESFCAIIDHMNFILEDRFLTKRSEKTVSKKDGMKPILENKKSESDDSHRDKTSTKITKATVIWNKFLNPIEANLDTFPIIPSSHPKKQSASGQHLFLSKRVLHNTHMRLSYEDLYGPNVFAEAVKEVLVVLKEIFLRFLKSALYTKMCASGQLVYRYDEKWSSLLPKSNRLFVKPPESKILSEVYRGQSHKGEDYQFELLEIITDGLLYNDFLSRLKAIMCDESLLCVRMITIFKELMVIKTIPKSTYTNGRSSMGEVILQSLTSGLSSILSLANPTDSKLPSRRSSTSNNIDGQTSPTPSSPPCVDKMQIITKAWEIYSYFIAYGAIFEISLPPRQRISIMRQLGNPKADMFDQLLSMAMRDLNFSFHKYKETENYRSMNKRALYTAVMIQSIEAGTGGSVYVRIRRKMMKKYGRVHVLNT